MDEIKKKIVINSIKLGKIKLIQKLKNKQLEQILDSDGNNVYLKAAAYGSIGIMQYVNTKHPSLVDSKNKYGENAFLVACSKNRLQVILYLLGNNDYETMLSSKNNNELDATMLAILNNSLDVIIWLAKINAIKIHNFIKNKNALMVAVEKGNFNIIQTIFDCYNAKDRSRLAKGKIQDEYLVFDIARKLKNNYKIFSYLKERIDINKLYWTAINKNNFPLVKFLLVHYRSSYRNIKGCVDLYSKNKDGLNIFLYACNNGHLEILKLIDKIRPELFVSKDFNDNNGYILAACNDHLNVIKYLNDNIPTVCYTDEEIHDFFHQITKLKYNAFTSAVWFSHINTVKYFIQERKLDFYLKNNEGMDALSIACEKNSLDIVKYLIDTCNWRIYKSHLNVTTSTEIKKYLYYHHMKTKFRYIQPSEKLKPNKHCLICLDDFQSEDEYIKCPSKHLIHFKCFIDWHERKKNMNCILCKEKYILHLKTYSKCKIEIDTN